MINLVITILKENDPQHFCYDVKINLTGFIRIIFLITGIIELSVIWCF